MLLNPAYKYVYLYANLFPEGGKISHSCELWVRLKIQKHQSSMWSHRYEKHWRGFVKMQRRVDVSERDSDSESPTQCKLFPEQRGTRWKSSPGKSTSLNTIQTSERWMLPSAVGKTTNVMFAFILCLCAERMSAERLLRPQAGGGRSTAAGHFSPQLPDSSELYSGQLYSSYMCPYWPCPQALSHSFSHLIQFFNFENHFFSLFSPSV